MEEFLYDVKKEAAYIPIVSYHRPIEKETVVRKYVSKVIHEFYNMVYSFRLRQHNIILDKEGS